jgi:hypothetical protein
MSRTKLPLGGRDDVKFKLFPPSESLVWDIPAGDGNIAKAFFNVWFSRDGILRHKFDKRLQYFAPCYSLSLFQAYFKENYTLLWF